MLHTRNCVWVFLLLFSPLFLLGQFSAETVKISPPERSVVGKVSEIELELLAPLAEIQSLEVEVNGVLQRVAINEGRGYIEFQPAEKTESIQVRIADYQTEVPVYTADFPRWLSLLPPLIAIAFALLFREVIVSLFIGILFGAVVLGIRDHGGWMGIGSGFLAVLDTYILDALADRDHLAIILFSVLIGGMVAIISRNGGMQGIVNRISKMAKTPRTVQFATWLMGLVIFFDDYANTLVVGNTMRSITDKLRVSREKLSYIVDSTAAPVAALAFITTWIGAELGYIQDGIQGLAAFPEGQSPYTIFLNSLAYSFYPIFTLIFILLLIYLGKDFGPMLKAETRARILGEVSKLSAKEAEELEIEMRHFRPLTGLPLEAYQAVVPIVVLILGVFIGLIYTGYDAAIWSDPANGFFTKLSSTVGNSDSYAALLWGSLSAVAVAIGLTVWRRIMPLTETVETLTNGIKSMLGAIMILTFAWSLQGVIEDMGTASYLQQIVGNWLPAWALPVITFLLSALVAFSTGSSWGTMAILYPLLVPLAWNLSLEVGLDPDSSLQILYNVVSSVLAGSVLGDHCSPISDTTILSSMASSCNHIDHVRTQLPYALTVGVVATLLGTLPAALGVPSWICFPVGIAALYGVVRYWGKPVPAVPTR
jgi:Na+/H+ antiporter NhaC